MGRTHTTSAAAGWLAGCATATAVGWTPSTTAVIVGALVAAGSALLPDIDHPQSTISASLGPITGIIAWLVAAGGAWLRGASCDHCRQRRDGGGHRMVTHTVVFALGVGLAVTAAGWAFGSSAGLPVVWMATALTARVMLTRRQRGAFGAVAAACLVTAAVGGTAAASWWWIGLPVAWGTLAHSLGDAATLSGAPLAWPLRVAGCRWTRIGTPRVLRFRTGGGVEQVVWVLLAVGSVGAAGYLAAG